MTSITLGQPRSSNALFKVAETMLRVAADPRVQAELRSTGAKWLVAASAVWDAVEPTPGTFRVLVKSFRQNSTAR